MPIALKHFTRKRVNNNSLIIEGGQSFGVDPRKR